MIALQRIECCNGDCRQGRECPLRKKEIDSLAVIHLAILLAVSTIAGVISLLYILVP